MAFKVTLVCFLYFAIASYYSADGEMEKGICKAADAVFEKWDKCYTQSQSAILVKVQTDCFSQTMGAPASASGKRALFCDEKNKDKKNVFKGCVKDGKVKGNIAKFTSEEKKAQRDKYQACLSAA